MNFAQSNHKWNFRGARTGEEEKKIMILIA